MPPIDDDTLDALATALGPDVRRDVRLGSYTTYGVGGRASLLYEVAEERDLARVAKALAAHRVPVLVLGLGSNLLIADDGFRGLALVLGESFTEIRIEDTSVVAGGRAKLPVVARQTAAAGLTGFEWAAGVPGSIGGAVRMNAGVPNAEMADSLVRVKVIDLARGKEAVLPVRHLDLGYRTSNITADQVVVWAQLELETCDPALAQTAIRQKTQWRREHQPGGRNAGSVFANPPGDSAGRLIEAAGCKGMRIGSAEVSHKHANFIVVDEFGRAADVWHLMDEVHRRVYDHSAIDLHPETIMVGLPKLRRVGP